MAASSKSERLGIWGASGSGKSYYAKKRYRAKKRVIVFDPQDEYASEGFARVTGSVDGVRQAFIKNFSGARVCYVPPAGQEVAALNRLSRLVTRMQERYRAGKSKSEITMIVDELNSAYPNNMSALTFCAGFADLCRRGRHSGVWLVGISQRIAEVHTSFRGNCTETVVFRQKGAVDQRAAALELGINQVELIGLKNYHFISERNGKIMRK